MDPGPIGTGSKCPAPRVFICRHGERADEAQSDWWDGEENTYDPPLTTAGQQQAHQLGKYLQDKGVTVIYASPLLRTIQTAQQIAAVLKLPIRIEYGLCEAMYTTLFPEGAPVLPSPKQRRSEFPCIDTAYTCPETLPFPESPKQLAERAELVARQLAEENSGETLLLVTHAATHHKLAVGLAPDEHFPYSGHHSIPFCSLSECVWHAAEGRYHIALRAESSFLEECCAPSDSEGSPAGATAHLAVLLSEDLDCGSECAEDPAQH